MTRRHLSRDSLPSQKAISAYPLKQSGNTSIVRAQSKRILGGSMTCTEASGNGALTGLVLMTAPHRPIPRGPKQAHTNSFEEVAGSMNQKHFAAPIDIAIRRIQGKPILACVWFGQNRQTDRCSSLALAPLHHYGSSHDPPSRGTGFGTPITEPYIKKTLRWRKNSLTGSCSSPDQFKSFFELGVKQVSRSER